jgi:DNA-binding MarR family transcriptional regulator
MLHRAPIGCLLLAGGQHVLFADLTIVRVCAYYSSVRDTNDRVPSVEDVANHLLAAFRPRHGGPSSWPARDVTLGQLRTLFMVRSEGPISIGRLAESFGIGAAAASGYVERIERHGLVERRHRTDDRRIVDCHLTESGRRLLDELAGVQTEALRRALTVLTPEERLALDTLLREISARLSQADQGGTGDAARESSASAAGVAAAPSCSGGRERQR